MKVSVCMGSKCVMLGNMSILTQLEELKETMPELELEIETVKCMGLCKESENNCPIVKIDDEIMYNAKSQDVMEKVTAQLNK